MDINEVKKESDELIAEMRAVKLDIEKFSHARYAHRRWETCGYPFALVESLAECNGQAGHAEGAFHDLHEVYVRDKNPVTGFGYFKPYLLYNIVLLFEAFHGTFIP